MPVKNCSKISRHIQVLSQGIANKLRKNMEYPGRIRNNRGNEMPHLLNYPLQKSSKLRVQV